MLELDRYKHARDHRLRVSISDGQGFWKPHGYMSKGTAGKGQGTYLETLGKPLPLSGVRGHPWYMPQVFIYTNLFLLLLLLYNLYMVNVNSPTC